MLFDGERVEIDLMLFDGERVEIDLLQTLNLLFLNQTSQLGHWDPFLVLLASTPTASTTSPASSASSSTASVAKASSESSSSTITGWSSVRHVIFLSLVNVNQAILALPRPRPLPP